MYRLFIVAALAAGCGAGLEVPGAEGREALSGGETLCPPGQTQVCHQQESRCVPEGALDGHLGHGDLEGPCSYLGTPPLEEPPAWMPHVPASPQQVEEEPFAQPSSALRAGVSVPAWLPGTPTPPAQVEAESAEPAPAWTPQAPKEPVPLCGAEVGDPCGGTFAGCCEGLRCEWGVCVPD